MNNFIRQEDGFINATAICKAGGKRFNNWYRLETTKKIIKKISVINNINQEKIIIIISKGPNNLRGSWIHPDLAVQLAQWISTNFCVKVSKWIEEWKLTSLKNNLEFEKAINNIEADDKNSCIEKEIQLKLQKKIGGEIEVYTEFGYIDLLTDKELIEIKIGNKWKHGVGQLLAYGEYYENHILRLHLFDFKEDFKIESFCKKYNIKLTYE
jgi:hypothetical protein